MATSDVWVFTGARSSPTDSTPTFPAGVFSSVAIAEAWIKQHGLSVSPRIKKRGFLNARRYKIEFINIIAGA